jgi:PRD1 phage membrane DNA delivery
MSEHLVTSIVTVVMAIIGVAIIAILVSRNANTTSVLQSAGGAFQGALGTALSPVTGASSFGGLGTGLLNNPLVTG